MLAELVDKLARLGVEAKCPVEMHFQPEPAYVYHVWDGQKLLCHTATPHPRNHTVLDVPTLAKFALECELSAVWFSRRGVVCYLDDGERRNQVTMKIVPSPQILLLEKIAGTAFDQKQFLHLFRTTLHGTVDPSLVNLFKHVKFRQDAQAESIQKHGTSSVGKHLLLEMSGCGQIPEETILRVLVWEGTPRRYAVPCALEIDPASERFTLTPLPNEVENAYREAEACLGKHLREALGEDYELLYYGHP